VNPRTKHGRNIPWLTVVQFHKEIAARAESSFFSIHAKDSDSERWTSLDQFQPDALSGPWKIGESTLVSNAFKLSVEQGAHETIFIGGPCYLAWEKGFKGGWMPQWRPILYREVRALITNGIVEILPDQGNWNLSPLVLNMIERLQLSIGKGTEEFIEKVLELSAEKITTSEISELSAAIMDVISNLIPDIEDELSKSPQADTFVEDPSPWILFAPTTRFSALTRHLMADYERLESLLIDDKNNIGGLSVLDDSTIMPALETPPILPLIPINDAQRKAVENMFGNRSLTVISGPPGCGKSQVVVSLLLNAWAVGKSVLFASNNNAAVDVVKDRLEKFESEFPIAVRAGNRKKNNIIELLRRTLNYAADSSSGKSAISEYAGKRKSLITRLGEYQHTLDERLPQRIDEGMRTALHAYGVYRGKLEKIENAENEFDKRWQSLNLPSLELEELAGRAADSRKWLDTIESFKELQQKDHNEKLNQEQLIAKAEIERNAIVSSVGQDPNKISDWDWLVDGPPVNLLKAWEERLVGVLEMPLGESLAAIEWSEIFNKWTDADDASNTAAQAKDFAESAKTEIAELIPRSTKILSHQENLKEKANALGENGLEAKLEIESKVLQSWTTAYSSLLSLLPGKFDFLPWSEKSKLNGKLKNAESFLRSYIPLTHWKEIGSLDDDGRSKLSGLVEILRTWRVALDAWEALEDERASVEEILKRLRAKAGRLGLTNIPAEGSPDDWLLVVDDAMELSSLAGSACIAWKKKTARENAANTISQITRSWRALASGQPLKEAWSMDAGSVFVASMDRLQDNPTPDNLVDFRSAYYSGSLKSLERSWKQAADVQMGIRDAKLRITKIPPPTQRVFEWFQTRTKDALILEDKPDAWPEIGPEIEFLDNVSSLIDEKTEFLNITKETLQSEAKQEYTWASEKLGKAIEILPVSSQKQELSSLLHQLRPESEQDWPLDKIAEHFREFSPEIIRANIDQINSELERGAFQESKANWLERLKEDEVAINAVDQLEKVLRKSKGQIKEEHFELFRETLRLVPIWITTAQAPQAIPLEPELFDLVVIDEASQCTLTNLLPLLYRGKRLAIIGDSEQLPSIPTIQQAEESALARKYEVEEFLTVIGHYDNDVYSAAADSLPRGRAGVLNLSEHFRSNPQIIGFSNRHIYQQRLVLKVDPERKLDIPIGAGVHRVSITGSVSRGNRGRSWQNAIEANRVVELIEEIRSQNSMRHLSVGVVTPFAAQKEFLRERLAEIGYAGEVLVDSAYGFQGDERDVIIFSAVVGSGITASASRWVESPPNLINVALTRARHALFVVADFDYCMQQDPGGMLRKLAEYCRDVQLLRDTSPAELELFSWMVVEGWTPSIHQRIGDLEVDFILKGSSGVRLAIEVDGQQYHTETEQKDQSRDAYLRAQGCRVFRIPARAVLETPYAVVQQIREKLDFQEQS